MLRPFADQVPYNLIVAPHVRLLDGKAAAARWVGLLADYETVPQIHIDRGSDRWINMTWTTLADVYLGDVSSQVYEFLRTPRPCVFLNTVGIQRRGDANDGYWQSEPVLDTTTDLVDAVDAARGNHGDFVATQTAGFAETFSTDTEPVYERALRAIVDFMQGRSE